MIDIKNLSSHHHHQKLTSLLKVRNEQHLLFFDASPSLIHMLL